VTIKLTLGQLMAMILRYALDIKGFGQLEQDPCHVKHPASSSFIIAAGYRYLAVIFNPVYGIDLQGLLIPIPPVSSRGVSSALPEPSNAQDQRRSGGWV
jgi:hypothetical protein